MTAPAEVTRQEDTAKALGLRPKQDEPECLRDLIGRKVKRRYLESIDLRRALAKFIFSAELRLVLGR